MLYYFVLDVIAFSDIVVSKVGTQDNLADMLINSLDVAKFGYCLYLIGICCQGKSQKKMKLVQDGI